MDCRCRCCVRVGVIVKRGDRSVVSDSSSEMVFLASRTVSLRCAAPSVGLLSSVASRSFSAAGHGLFLCLSIVAEKEVGEVETRVIRRVCVCVCV